MTHHFNSIEDLLAMADKKIARLQKLFPAADARDLKVNVLLYLLKNSTIKTHHEKTPLHTGKRAQVSGLD